MLTYVSECMCSVCVCVCARVRVRVRTHEKIYATIHTGMKERLSSQDT